MTNDSGPRAAASKIALVAIGLGTSTSALDTSVNVAFPAIVAAFGMPLVAVQWIPIAYVLTYSSLLLAFGKLGDRLGHARIFRLGLAVGAAAFAILPLTTTYPQFLLARVLQGLGAALVMSCGPALTAALYPPAERVRAVAAYTFMFGLGIAAGPVLGGLLLETFGWSGVFWFRAPIALLALLLMALPLRIPPQARDEHAHQFDLAGAFYLSLAVAAGLLAFSLLQFARQDPLAPLVLALVALVAGWAYAGRARAHGDPIINPTLFRERRFAVINVTNIFVNFTGFAAFLIVPFYLLGVARLTALEAGMLMAMAPIGNLVGSPAAAFLVRRIGQWPSCFLGLSIAIGGLLMTAAWEPRVSFPLIGATFLVQGLGFGIFQVAYMDQVMAGLPITQRGVAGSLAFVTRTFGTIVSASSISIVFAALGGTGIGGAAAGSDDFVFAFRTLFQLLAGGLAALLALTALLGRAGAGRRVRAE
jgi:MFS family permease